MLSDTDSAIGSELLDLLMLDLLKSIPPLLRIRLLLSQPGVRDDVVATILEDCRRTYMYNSPPGRCRGIKSRPHEDGVGTFVDNHQPHGRHACRRATQEAGSRSVQSITDRDGQKSRLSHREIAVPAMNDRSRDVVSAQTWALRSGSEKVIEG